MAQAVTSAALVPAICILSTSGAAQGQVSEGEGQCAECGLHVWLTCVTWCCGRAARRLTCSLRPVYTKLQRAAHGA